ncbi:hypothetical protein G5I_07935 [Acromyrmex echinatior]|uniref:Uncharacterized protein n=1 Tax=Acromyrmex echinatior TaxID=103372 RepID=F4WQ75_ACREC|nr:hypothetical protein G5I_07935 [Acromyrmex echinatior]
MISLFFHFTNGIFGTMLLKVVSRNTAMLDERILRGFPQRTLTRMVGRERMLRAAKRFISGSRDRVGHRPDGFARTDYERKRYINPATSPGHRTFAPFARVCSIFPLPLVNHLSLGRPDNNPDEISFALRENAAKKLRTNEITLLLPPSELDL